MDKHDIRNWVEEVDVLGEIRPALCRHSGWVDENDTHTKAMALKELRDSQAIRVERIGDGWGIIASDAKWKDGNIDGYKEVILTNVSEKELKDFAIAILKAL